MSRWMRAAVAGLLMGLVWMAAWGADSGGKWALVVGIDRYDTSDVAPLSFAGADAKAVARALVDAAGFDAEHVIVMTSDAKDKDRPTRTNILRKLSGLCTRVRPGDTFVFYFSGHGVQDRNKVSYLLAADTDTSSDDMLQLSSLPTHKVQEAIGGLQATRILQIVDACRNDPHAGRGGGDNKLTQEFARDLVVAPRAAGAGPGIAATLFACQPGQRSYEGYKGHGYFSYFLEQGLRGAAAGPDGLVTMASLKAYLEARVPDAVSVHENGKEQVPYALVMGTGEAQWVLSRAVAVVAPPSPPEPRVTPTPAPTPRPAAPPQVRVTAPGASSRTSKEYVTLVGTVTAAGGVSDVTVSVNGGEVALSGPALRRTAGGAQVNVRVPLEVGENTVVLMATGSSGLPGQAVVTVEREAARPAVSAPVTSSSPAAAPAVASSRPSTPVAARPRPTPAPVAYVPAPRPQSNEMVNETDGSVLLRIPGDTFTMGSSDYTDEKPPHAITVAPFWLGKYEVTNAQYRRFVTATGHQSAGDWEKYARDWGDRCPVVNVSWNDAVAYCRWAGGRLPTEAEWEYAARGTRSLKYPWGSEWDANRCVNRTNTGARARPVGSYPSGASPFGCLDMAGNVVEWCSSKYKPYPYSAGDGREDPGGSDSRVLRGGSWCNYSDLIFRGAGRIDFGPGNCFNSVGFRLARTQ